MLPHRVKSLVCLEGIGIPSGRVEDAPGKIRKWLDAIADPPMLRPYASLAEAADRLQKTNPHLHRDRAELLAEHWAEATVEEEGARHPGARLVGRP